MWRIYIYYIGVDGDVCEWRKGGFETKTQALIEADRYAHGEPFRVAEDVYYIVPQPLLIVVRKE